MIYEVHLYVTERESFFLHCMRRNGLYWELASQIPGWLGQDLLRNHQQASEFLCLTFWATPESYSSARKYSQPLIALLSKLTTFSANLGTYSHPMPERLIPSVPEAPLTRRTGKPVGLSGALSPDPGDTPGGFPSDDPEP